MLFLDFARNERIKVKSSYSKGGFAVSGGDAAELFEMSEYALDTGNGESRRAWGLVAGIAIKTLTAL